MERLGECGSRTARFQRLPQHQSENKLARPFQGGLLNRLPAAEQHAHTRAPRKNNLTPATVYFKRTCKTQGC